MKKRNAFALFGLGLAGIGAAYAYRRYIWARLLGLPAPQYDVFVQENIRTPTRDGLRLATDVYRPHSVGQFPTILIRTPYGRGGRAGFVTGFTARRIAEQGYNVVCQDVRGRFDSDGEFEPYVHEATDAEDTLNWIARQTWFDGQVGTWGQSYLGYTQWAAAATGSPHLKAMVPIITHSSLNPSWDHGFTLGRTLRWLLTLDALTNDQLTLGARLGRVMRADVQNRVLAAAFKHLPLATADEVALGKPVPFYKKWVQHFEQDDDAYWQQTDRRAGVAGVTASVHLVGGWYDIFIRGQLADYERLRAAGRNPYLTVGPWTHLSFEGQLESLRQSIAWFDAHLKGYTGRLRAQPVRIYVMGADEWRDLDRWPPPATPTTYYLHGNATCAPIPPMGDVLPNRYRYDPADPTPNLGGALLSSDAGPIDNRPLEARNDVLTFTTPPLIEEVEVIGNVKLVLYAKSSRAHTDFFGRLCDVHPTGESLNICDGLFRVKPGRGKRQPSGCLKIEIDLGPTAHRFLAGHRIRVLIASGAHPRIARNLGIGEPIMHGTQMQPAEQTIYHDADHQSALILPRVG